MQQHDVRNGGQRSSSASSHVATTSSRGILGRRDRRNIATQPREVKPEDWRHRRLRVPADGRELAERHDLRRRVFVQDGGPYSLAKIVRKDTDRGDRAV